MDKQKDVRNMVWWLPIGVILMLVFGGFAIWQLQGLVTAIAQLWPVMLIGVIGIGVYIVGQIIREKEKSKWEVLKTLLMLKKRRE